MNFRWSLTVIPPPPPKGFRAQNRDIPRSLGSPLSLSSIGSIRAEAAVAFITVCLLTILIPLLLCMVWWNFCYYKDFLFGNRCESPECEESISKLKIVRYSKLQTHHRDISAF
jgi:hypothetical protein